MKKLQVYAINLKKRTDRKNSIIKEFNGKAEFNLNLVEAFEDKIGAIGLWKTIIHIIKELVPEEEEFIVICEDDHKFTKWYNTEKLRAMLSSAKQYDADVLSGGVSWFETALQVNSNLFWIDKFSGLQFTVIYRKFFKNILEADFKSFDAADFKISALTENKLLIYPFISTQEEFGYSDATTRNNVKGRVTRKFRESSEKLEHLKKVAQFYQLEVTK